MTPTDLGADRFRKAFVLALTAAITIVFLATIRDFLMALLLAAVLAGLCRRCTAGWRNSCAGAPARRRR